MASVASTPKGNVAVRFGNRLRTVRKNNNLTQEVMADRFGINRSFISDVERGRKAVTLHMLETLADGLHLSMADLIRDI